MSSVYFVQAGGERGPIKIGFAKLPAQRLIGMQTDCPLELHLLYAFPAKEQHTQLESAWHHLFDDHSIRGEWFRWSTELESAIEALRSFGSTMSPVEYERRLCVHARANVIFIEEQKAEIGCAIHRASARPDIGLYCSQCGCYHAKPGTSSHRVMLEHGMARFAGETCNDHSGGTNTRMRPCRGLLQLEQYTDEVRLRQERSISPSHSEADC